MRQAHRALRGQVLRSEVYAEDDTGRLATLYTVTEQAASVVLLEKFVVQPQDVAIMDTMTEKQCVPGKSRWVEADLGAARYVQWRRRRLGKEARRAPPAVPQARP